MSDFKHLKWFQENLAKDKLFIGIVLYCGEFISKISENLWAMPFGALWSSQDN